METTEMIGILGYNMGYIGVIETKMETRGISVVI